jgi:hypothetical protein
MIPADGSRAVMLRGGALQRQSVGACLHRTVRSNLSRAAAETSRPNSIAAKIFARWSRSTSSGDFSSWVNSSSRLLAGALGDVE